MGGWGFKGGGVLNAPFLPAAEEPLFFNEVTRTWSLPPARIAALRASGTRIRWIGEVAPTSADGAQNGDLRHRRDGTLSTVTLTPTPVNDMTVAYSGSAWDKTPTQVSTARAAGGKITWNGTTVLPKASDGLGEGDTVTGTFTQAPPAAPLAKISIPTWTVPTAVDAPGVSGDVVRLKKYIGLTWAVDGVDYNSSAMSTNTVDVPAGGKASVVVSAKPSKPQYFSILESTSSWTLNFDTTISSTTPVSITSEQAPTATDNGATATFGSYITLTSVPGTIWTVDGVDYPSSGFTGTRRVEYLKGTNTTVTVRVTGPEYVLSGTTSWPLTFTNVAGNTALPVVSSASFDALNGNTYTNNATGENYTLAGGLDAAFGGATGDMVFQKGGTYSVTEGALSVDGYLSIVWPSLFSTSQMSRYMAFTTRGNGAAASHGLFRARLMQNGTTNGVAVMVNGGTATVQTMSGNTWSDVAGSSFAATTGSVVGIGYDNKVKKIYLTVNGALVWSGAYTMPGVTANAALATTAGAYVNRIDNLIGWAV